MICKIIQENCKNFFCDSILKKPWMTLLSLKKKNLTKFFKKENQKFFFSLRKSIFKEQNLRPLLSEKIIFDKIQIIRIFKVLRFFKEGKILKGG